MASSRLKVYTIRLRPGQEIKSTLLKFAVDNNLFAPFIMTCVGSVTRCTLRLAKPKDGNDERIKTFNQCFEIVSLVGTLSQTGHLHTSLSDEEGNVVGGHVMGDMIVYTTAEVVIGDCVDLCYEREFDTETNFSELVVKPLGTDSGI